MSAQLRSKIQTKKAHIAVIGLGYVGLPLAVKFAQKGYSVLGLDKDQDRVENVNLGKSYILDVKNNDLRQTVKSAKLSASTDFKALKDVDVILICVPTPLKRKYTPDIGYILRAVRTIRKYLKKNTLVVLESTTYPGTTEELILPELQKDGYKVGRDFLLSFSPERIDPGNKTYDVTKIPKLVGGITDKSGVLTKLLYEKIIRRVHLLSSAKAAEMAKLLENSFRIINIGWINEVAMMCHKMDVDVWEVIEAAKTKPFGFMPFYPGLGVGGHCIPDDPLYLHWKAKHHGFNSKFIKLSSDINSQMPQYTAERLRRILNKPYKNIKVLIVGVTYKKDVKDLRKSPSLKLIEILLKKRCQVDYYDPIIPYLDIGNINKKSIKLDKKSILKYNCVLITVDHSKINYNIILRNARRIFDIRNVFNGKQNKKIVRF